MTTVTSTLSRAQNLKHATADTHDNVDKSIMAQEPFTNTQSYLDFLRLQFYFLKDVSALYEHPELLALIPDLAARRRLGMLEQDFIDLETHIPAPYLTSEIADDTDVATALGWLYVVEGSKVGAAMLGKQVEAKLSFNAQHGARYLAGPGAGRGSAWRELVQIIDSIELSEQQEQALVEGARQAFTRFQAFQAHVYP
ncbi:MULTISPECIES: biliverdin-producing heme oxygenase [Pseudoalteromonas]|uniref:biliverdin-producing heme oxygenase n=1 Tax=Pseudoalteromonas TaxID=53246 RepID=UPI000FFE9661|nr:MULTISPECIES: biliverdin-producing heme oxygenase [Pseudoalteromonas]MCG9761326.1 biliverdin-producing heme oxygenase [Pseudoalteromonas sp. Isolate6]NKC18058.1 heme oxygenase [Pseudoalteromonas galatheae]RXE85427.1 heme oxygenase [Pseudoalteromonas sp. A757]